MTDFNVKRTLVRACQLQRRTSGAASGGLKLQSIAMSTFFSMKIITSNDESIRLARWKLVQWISIYIDVHSHGGTSVDFVKYEN